MTATEHPRLELQRLHRGVALPTVLAAAASALGDLTALLYAPHAFSFATWSGGTLSGPNGTLPLEEIEGVYEARAFSSAGEVRWLLTPGGSEAVVIASEGAAVDPAQVADVQEWPQGRGARPLAPHGYLLWGKVEKVVDGWSVLREKRVPPISVPFAAQPAVRLRLTATEWITLDAHGNASVVEELLQGFAEVR